MISLQRAEKRAPVPLLICAPQKTGISALVVFQHGFLTRNSSYLTLLCHLASHGLVAVAPQMYEPGALAMLGRPTAIEEARLVTDLLDWLPDHLSAVTGVETDVRGIGIAGHSRGGKVAWHVASTEPTRIRAIAGVDPVDGMGGPWGNQPRILVEGFRIQIPSLIIGAGHGGLCAPEGENHIVFYAATPSPAWHVTALNQGHADMLDEDANEAKLARIACPTGPDRDGMRRLTAGLLVAFFRGTLCGDRCALAYLTDASSAPIPVYAESK